MITLHDVEIERPFINHHDSKSKTFDVEFALLAMCRATFTEEKLGLAVGANLSQKLRSMFLGHDVLLAPPSVTGDVLELIRAVCAGSTTALPKLIDELIHQGHEPDGDVLVDDEWFAQEFGFISNGKSICAKNEGGVVCWKFKGHYTDGNLHIRTRRDARAIVRMGGYK